MKKFLIICSLIALGFQSCQSVETKSQESKTVWEHKVVKMTGKGIKAQTSMLNELGLQGWEVIGLDTEVTTHYTNGASFSASINVGTCAINCLFKRPLAGVKTPNGRTAWEYKIVQIAGKKLATQNKTLNDLGAEGWEAITTFSELGTLGGYSYWNVCDIRTTSVDYMLRNTFTPTTEPAPATEAVAAPQPKWEYKIIQVGGKGIDTHTKMLNDLGKEGWIIVSTHCETGESGLQRSGWRAAYINTYAVDHVFKRRVAQSTESLPQPIH